MGGGRASNSESRSANFFASSSRCAVAACSLQPQSLAALQSRACWRFAREVRTMHTMLTQKPKCRTLLVLQTQHHGRRRRRRRPVPAQARLRLGSYGKAVRGAARGATFGCSACCRSSATSVINERTCKRSSGPGHIAIPTVLLYASRPGDGASGYRELLHRCPLALAATTSGACAPAADHIQVKLARPGGGGTARVALTGGQRRRGGAARITCVIPACSSATSCFMSAS